MSAVTQHQQMSAEGSDAPVVFDPFGPSFTPANESVAAAAPASVPPQPPQPQPQPQTQPQPHSHPQGTVTGTAPSAAIVAPRAIGGRMLQPQLLVVPTYPINYSMDEKFNADPYGLDLMGLLSEAEYSSAIASINAAISKARSTKIDAALLATGALLVPLLPWAARRMKQKKLRKRLLKAAIAEFNDRHPTLLMRWAKKPASRLTIERRPQKSSASASTSVALTV